jgi:integrase
MTWLGLSPTAGTVAIEQQVIAARGGLASVSQHRLHDVRHPRATHLLTAGVPVHIVAARLGHSSPVVTLNTNAHVLPTSDEQAAKVMASVPVR